MCIRDSEHIEQMRLSATKSLLERRDAVIVATVSAIYGIGDPSEYHGMILHLRQGEKMAQRDVLARLVAMQYTRNELDFRRGTFRVRGDVIDVFPAEHAEHAIRISLFDDEVEKLEVFDPLTGRVQHPMARFTVYPSSHYVTPRETTLRAIDAIKAELRERIEFFPENAVEYFVSYYDYYQPEAYVPARDLYIEKDSSINCLLYTSPSPRDKRQSRMPSSA